MDFKKSPDQAYYAPQAPTAYAQLPITNERAAETKSNSSKFVTLVCTLGVLGCVFLLFHLYIDTAVHHAVMDHNLQKLEAEVHSVFKMQFDQMNNATVRDSSSRVVYGGHGHSGFDSHKNVLQERRWTSRRSKHHYEVANVKRGGGATFTWFHPGAGACGGHQTDNDYIIAISHLIWDGGSHCGDTVAINYKGKTVQATVQDECMGCDANHIDLSPKLLHDLAGAGVDQVTDGEWSFGNAPAPPPPPPQPKPEPKPTTHSTPPPPPPTTTTHHQYTTSTSSDSSTTSTSKSTSSSSTVLSSTVSSSSSSASPSATPALDDDGQVHNFQDLGVLINKIGGMAMSAALVLG